MYESCLLLQVVIVISLEGVEIIEVVGVKYRGAIVENMKQKC